MKADDVETTIRRYIVNEIMFKKDESVLEFDASLLEQGVLDSAAMVELIAFLEGEFGISVARTDMVPENFETVSSIAQYVRSQ
ncbi:MAG: acyl carrier protein [Ignavibacteria bacterium]|nr:acyl carrier protein [Ignavibacteria bacterium]